MRDILLGNNNKTIIKRLAKQSVQAEKRSNYLLILTIALAVGMIFSIVLSSSGATQEFKNAQKEKAQISIIGATDEQLAALQNRPGVSWIGELSLLGFSYQGSSTLTVYYADETYLGKQAGLTYTGRLPADRNEIMLPQNYMGREYRIGDTISIDLTGMGETEEYRISAILNVAERSSNYNVYVAKAKAAELFKSGFQITAYTRLATEAIETKALESLGKKAVETTGIEAGQVFITEYSAIMTGVIKPSLPQPVLLFAGLAALLAGFVIYGIFYTMITKNVQTLGQLRTIGMTRPQIKKMVKKEGRQFIYKGIPVGLAAGAVIGYVICPGGFQIKTTIFWALIITVLTYIIINFAINKPVRVAMNTSPLEGAKYQSYTGKKEKSRKLYRKLTPSNLAIVNISRNRAKTIFTLLMLGISGALLITASTVAGSIDAETMAKFKYFPVGEIQLHIQNTARSTFDEQNEPYRSTRLQLTQNPLSDQALWGKLRAIDGVTDIVPASSVYFRTTVPDGSTIISDYYPAINKGQAELLQNVLSSGSADYDDMVANNGVLASSAITKIGDKFAMEGRSGDGSVFHKNVIVVGVYDSAKLMENCPLVPGSPNLIFAYDTVKAFTGVTDQTGVLSIAVEPQKLESVTSAIKAIADESDKIDIYTMEQNIKNIQRIYDQSIKTLYLFAAILFVFGNVSLTNTLFVDYMNRRREFGLLQAVGMTKGQLGKMLRTELHVYLGGAFGLSAIGGTAAGAIACNVIDKANHCINYHYPWAILLLLMIALFCIQLVFTLFSSREIKQTAVLDAVKAY